MPSADTSVCDLRVLDKRHALETDPMDGIVAVTVTGLTLMPLDTSADGLFPVSPLPGCHRSVWEVTELRYGKDAHQHGYWPVQAQLEVRYRASGPGGQARRSFRLAHGRRVDLDVADSKIRQYLPCWGLVAGHESQRRQPADGSVSADHP